MADSIQPHLCMTLLHISSHYLTTLSCYTITLYSYYIINPGAPRAAGGASSVGRAWRPGAAVPVGPGAAPAGGPEAAAPGLPAASATAGEVGADSRAAGTAFGLPLCSKTKDITQPCIEAQPGVGWAGSASWLNSGSWPGSGGVGWGGINPAWSWLWPHPHSAGCSCPKVVLHPAARHTPDDQHPRVFVVCVRCQE